MIVERLKQIDEKVSATSYSDSTKELTVVLQQKLVPEGDPSACGFTIDVRERYFDIPPEAAKALDEASDKTAHLLENIRGKYVGRYIYI